MPPLRLSYPPNPPARPANPPPLRLSYRNATLSLVAAIAAAYISARAPLTLLLLSPVLLLVGAVAWVAFDLYATWWIERLVLRRLQEALEEAGGEGGGGAPGRSVPAAGKKRTVPPLAFTSPAAWSVTQTRASWESHTTSFRLPFPSAPPSLTTSIDSLLDLILRDFVLKWFSSISGSPAFPHAVERTIRETLATLSTRVGALDWSDVLVGRVLPLVTRHVETFRTAEFALRGQDLRTQLTESDELDLFLAERYALEARERKLHPAVDVASPNSRPAEEAWLSALVGKLLPLIMPEREVDSAAVRIIVREILACAVLLPVVELLSDPDFWNRIIDDKAGAAIRDQKMVTQFREALDKQGSAISPPSVPGSSPAKRARRAEEISASTNIKQFEAFVRGIGRCSSLLDARRLRSDVAGQIRKTRALVEGRRKDEIVDGHKVSHLIDYIERLYVAKRRADKRIEELGGQDMSSRQSIAGDTPIRRPHSRISLRDILLQPTSLSYFMEFEDRRRRSFRVQFWLLMEGLKDPLEDVEDESDDEAILLLPTSSAIATAREDMKMVWDAYFSTNALSSNQKYIRIVRDFVEGDPAADISAKDLRRVRRAVFAAQRDVLAEMEEEDFPDFSKSDLYFKALADLPDTLASAASPPYSSSLSPPVTPRPRAYSNPRTPPSRLPLFARSTSPPPPTSPPLSPPLFGTSKPLFGTSQPLALQRTETAPPQVTIQAVFDQPPTARLTGSDGGGIFDRPPSRAASVGSVDSMGLATAKRRLPPLSDSLDFLMSSPGEVSADRSPLFEDEGSGGETPLREAGVRLEDDDYVQVQTIEAIQEALNTILATDARGPTYRPSPSLSSSREFAGRREANAVDWRGDQVGRASPTGGVARRHSPTAARIPEEKRRGKRVFDDDEDMDDLEPEDLEPDFDPKSIRLAAPGDLQLPVEIARLAATLEKLRNQEAVVGALIRKAELTGVASELKILVKSRESLRREMRALEFQKAQFESQEHENKLVPGRTNVTISGTTVGQANGQSFQLYLVEVHQLAADGTFGSGWIVTRRYSEFALLQSSLKEKYLAARQLDLPSKRLVASYSEGFIEQRRAGLEKYLQALVRIPIICQSNELRSFLSQQNISLPKIDVDAGKRNATLFPGQGLVRSFYRSVTSGIDDMISSGPSSMLETIIQQLSQQAAELSGIGGSGVQDEDLVGQLLAGKGGAGSGLGEEGLTYFTAPICDLFVTLFELKEKNNWLRRQAILIILQQVLGGTIERKFRDAVKMLLGPDQLIGYIGTLKDALWPGGQLKPKEPPRTAAQRLGTRDSANRKLSALMPDVAANLIGRANARQGARRLFAVLQNRRLNRHLIYSVLDEFLAVLFPELAQPPFAGP